MARYAGRLLAPAEGFCLWRRLFLRWIMRNVFCIDFDKFKVKFGRMTKVQRLWENLVCIKSCFKNFLEGVQKTGGVMAKLKKKTNRKRFFLQMASFFLLSQTAVSSGLTVYYTESWSYFLLFSWFSWKILSIPIFFYKEPLSMSLQLFHFTAIFEQLSMCSFSSSNP